MFTYHVVLYLSYSSLMTHTVQTILYEI